jgi:hypothetical protein
MDAEGQTVNQSKVLLGICDWLLRTSKEEKARIMEEEIMDSASRKCGSKQCPRREGIVSR